METNRIDLHDIHLNLGMFRLQNEMCILKFYICTIVLQCAAASACQASSWGLRTCLHTSNIVSRMLSLMGNVCESLIHACIHVLGSDRGPLMKTPEFQAAGLHVMELHQHQIGCMAVFRESHAPLLNANVFSGDSHESTADLDSSI